MLLFNSALFFYKNIVFAAKTEYSYFSYFFRYSYKIYSYKKKNKKECTQVFKIEEQFAVQIHKLLKSSFIPASF